MTTTTAKKAPIVRDRFRALDDADVAKALPANRIGCVVWWDSTLIQCSAPALHDALDVHAPSFRRHIKSPCAPFSALRRAISRAPKCERGFWREVGDDNGRLVFAFAEERVDAAGRTYQAREAFFAVVDAKTGLLTVEGTLPVDEEPKHSLATVQARYAVERGYLTARDIAEVLKKILLGDLKGARLKQNGAMFLLPLPDDTEVDGLARAFREAKSGVEILRFPVLADDAGTISQLRSPVRMSLLAEARELADEARQRRAEGTMRKTTLEARLRDAESIRNRAALFRDVLAGGINDVDAAVREAEAEIRETMQGLIKQLTFDGSR